MFWYQLPLQVAGAPLQAGPAGFSSSLDLQSISPNPATEAIVVRFALPADGPVSLDLLDVAGRKVATLHEGPQSAGVHEVHWTRGHQPDGIYMIRLRAGGLTEVGKLLLIR